MLELECQHRNFFDESSETFQLKKLNLFTDNVMFVTVPCISLTFLTFLKKMIQIPFDVKKEYLLLYYECKQNVAQSFEIIYKYLLGTKDINYLYKFEKVLFDNTLFFDNDIIIQCSKYRNGDLKTKQCLNLHFSQHSSLQISRNKFLLLNNHNQELAQKLKKNLFLHDDLFLIVFEYAHSLDFECFFHEKAFA